MPRRAAIARTQAFARSACVSEGSPSVVASVNSSFRTLVSALKIRSDRPSPRAASGSRFAPKKSSTRATMISHSQPRS